MTYKTAKDTEYIFIHQLHETCLTIKHFYQVAAQNSEGAALKNQMSSLATTLDDACLSLSHFQNNSLLLNNEQKNNLTKIYNWHKDPVQTVSASSTMEWLMTANKWRRQFITTLRNMIKVQKEKLLRYVLSDITAHLQLRHDQLLVKLQLDEKKMLEG